MIINEDDIKRYKMESRMLRVVLPLFIYWAYERIFGGISDNLELRGILYKDSILLQIISMNEMFVLGLAFSGIIFNDLRKTYLSALVLIFIGFFVVFPINSLTNYLDSTSIGLLEFISFWLLTSPMILGILINVCVQKFLLKNEFVNFEKI